MIINLDLEGLTTDNRQLTREGGGITLTLTLTLTNFELSRIDNRPLGDEGDACQSKNRPLGDEGDGADL